MNCQWWYYWCGAKLKKFRHEIFVFVFDTLWDWKEKVNINSKYYLLIEMKSRAKTNSCKSNLPDSAYLFSFDCRINYWIFLFLSFFLFFSFIYLWLSVLLALKYRFSKVEAVWQMTMRTFHIAKEISVGRGNYEVFSNVGTKTWLIMKKVCEKVKNSWTKFLIEIIKWLFSEMDVICKDWRQIFCWFFKKQVRTFFYFFILLEAFLFFPVIWQFKIFF